MKGPKMQVVILAGGMGRRLAPLTERVPKPMVQVSGKPFLQRQLDMMKFIGFSDFLILTGYLGEQIESFFSDGSKQGISIRYLRETKLLGTAGALKGADKELADEFVLLNGDTYFPVNFESMTDYFMRNSAIAVSAVTSHSYVKHAFNVRLDSDNYIIDYSRGQAGKMSHATGGASVYSKKILEFIPDNTVCSLEDDIYRLLIEKREFMGYISDLPFYDMGTGVGLKNLETLFSA